MNPLKYLVLTSLMLVSPLTFARERGGAIGNGGDIVRSVFIGTGKDIVRTVAETPALLAELGSRGHTVAELESILTIDVIKVVQKLPRDSGGSRVNAIGAVRSVRLKESTWFEMILKGVDIRKLVFHEMLRAIGVNDDDYVVSENLPEARRVVFAVDENQILTERIREAFRESRPTSVRAISRTSLVSGDSYRCQSSELLGDQVRFFEDIGVDIFIRKIMGVSVLELSDYDALRFYDQQGLLISMNANEGCYIVARLARDGSALALEKSCEEGGGGSLLGPSIALPGLWAHAYLYCSLSSDGENRSERN